MTDEPRGEGDVMRIYTNAEDLTIRLSLLLQDAFQVEGDLVEVDLIGERKIRIRSGRDRYELTVVKKR